MKIRLSPTGAPVLLAAVMLISLLCPGCATTKKTDWDSRVGTYTYDQAVGELGPPDKQAALSDGRTVAEWVTRRGRGGGLSVGTGFYGSRSGVSVGQTIGSGRQDRVLRLIFDADKRLTSWSQN